MENVDIVGTYKHREQLFSIEACIVLFKNIEIVFAVLFITESQLLN